MNANEPMLWTGPSFKPVIPRVAFKDVLVAQLWMLWDSRRIAVLVLSLALAMFLTVNMGGGMLPFLAGVHVTMCLAALAWGAAVWHAQEPVRRMEHREMPVPFMLHDLMRVLAGAMLFAGAYAIIAIVAMSDPGPWTWPTNASVWQPVAMTASLGGAYMLGAAAGMALRHPVAWLSGFVVSYVFVQEMLFSSMWQTYRRPLLNFFDTWGLEVAVGGPVKMSRIGRYDPLTYRFADVSEWLPAVGLWMSICTALFLIALRLRRT